MGECSAMRESMPLLLVEALDASSREAAHQHIETCAECAKEWAAYRDTWALMADVRDGQIGVSFDITSHVTVTGSPAEKSMVRLLSYVLSNEDRMKPSRSRAIEWVRQTYSDPNNADPEIADALAKVLRTDQHAG